MVSLEEYKTKSLIAKVWIRGKAGVETVGWLGTAILSEGTLTPLSCGGFLATTYSLKKDNDRINELDAAVENGSIYFDDAYNEVVNLGPSISLEDFLPQKVKDVLAIKKVVVDEFNDAKKYMSQSFVSDAQKYVNPQTGIFDEKAFTNDTIKDIVTNNIKVVDPETNVVIEDLTKEFVNALEDTISECVKMAKELDRLSELEKNLNDPGFHDYIESYNESKPDCPISFGFGGGSSGGDGSSDETPQGTEKDDVLVGGAGNDYISGKEGNDIISGGAGNDTLNGGVGNDMLYGGVGDDTLNGGEGNDTLFGGAGDDYLHGEEGNDTLYGGEGNDKIHGGEGNNTIYGGEGNDDITCDGNGNNTIYGGEGDDDITCISNGNNTINGGAGNDTLYVGNGNNTIYGGAGEDTIYVESGNLYIDGGSGNDSIHCSLDVNATIVGGEGNDVISSYSEESVTSVWNIGDGWDTVSLCVFKPSENHFVIRFGADIKPSDIYLTKANNGYDLLIKYKNSSTQGIKAEDFYGCGPEFKFSYLEFADGTIIKAADIKTGCWASACTSSQPEVPDDGIIRPKKGASKTPGTAGNDEFELDSSVTKPNTVTAGDGNDVINVSSTNGHNIKGEAGNDTITADGSNKLTLDGGEGDDNITMTNSLYGTVKGGAGNDTITVENAQNLATVDLGTGNDKLTLTDSALTTLKLVDGKNTVKAENSTIKTINGGLDDDDIALSDKSKSTTIKLNNGTNTLELDNSTVKTITGGVGDDTITLNGSTATTITAGLGDDSITLNADSTVTTVNLTNGINELNINGATVTTINGGKGTNTINVMSGSVAKLNGGTGADNVILAVDNTIAKLNAGDDAITVTGSGVKAYGLAGNDILSTKNSNGNLLDGGVGNDVIVVDGATTATVTGGKGSDSYELKNLQADGVITINNALKAKGDIDTMSIDRAAGSFTYTVDAKNNLTMTGNDGSQVVINGWKANGMAIHFSDGERSVEEVNSFLHKDINVAATKAGAGTAYSDTFIIGEGAKVTSSISGYSKYDTLDLSNYADCDLELTSIKNNLAIKLTRDDKAVGTVTLKNFLTSTSQMTNVVVGDSSYKIVHGAEGEWNLSKNMGMLADASLGFADNAAGTSSYAEEEHKDAKLLVSGNA